MTKKEQALKLIKQIRAKIISLKHGYITDEEFNNLVLLIKKMK